jgi:PiT family inorganic phosphate transporter
MLIAVLLLVLAAEFVNGWHDATNAIATVVSTRVLYPVYALMMASGLNVLGAILKPSRLHNVSD